MPVDMIDIKAIRERWHAVGSKLDERGRRLFAAGEVRAAGRGGKAAVAKVWTYPGLVERLELPIRSYALV
jgi:hypothetical protein